MLTDFQRFVIEARISIWSMANDRKYTIQRLEDLKMPIAYHLIYVVAFPGVQEQKHWRKELWTFFKKVNDLTVRCKVKISSDFLVHLFYEGWFGEHSDRQAAVHTAKEHLRMDNLGYTVDEAAILADPFKDLVVRLLKDPSCLWDEIN